MSRKVFSVLWNYNKQITELFCVVRQPEEEVILSLPCPSENSRVSAFDSRSEASWITQFVSKSVLLKMVYLWN